MALESEPGSPQEDAGPQTVRVLEVLDPPDGTTRYVDQVVSELPPTVSVDYFTWRKAFTTSYDVLHVHWPERLTRADGRWSTAANRLALLALLVRARVLRVAIVRTHHNLRPHEPGRRLETWLLGLLDRSTGTTIQLNEQTPPARRGRNVRVPLGHYVSSLGRHPRSERVPGRVLFFGLIRDYKGIPDLIDAFGALDDPALSLRIVGKPADSSWADIVDRATAVDPRISSRLEFVPDADLAAEVTEAQVIALPYRQMHNSGVLLVALSLGRPVLVPRTPTNTEIASELGDSWVTQYDGQLTAEVLRNALEQTRPEPAHLPTFVGRDWASIGRQHGEIYVDAARRSGRLGRRKRPTTARASG